MAKPIIYQILPRLWGNMTECPVPGGTLSQNGTGKFSNIDTATLDYLKSLGVSHVWFTGIIRHATVEDACGCVPSSAAWVKGRAGSPYAITDYYDVNPYLADDPSCRMQEFANLVQRAHEAGLKVVIDFVPNHVARDYEAFSAYLPDALRLGSSDDRTVHWREENDFFYYPDKALELPGGNADYEEFPAKASGNCYTFAPGVNDWYDTIKINYCDTHTSTWDKMLAILKFWADQGVDGFRCDMVELVPPAFFKWAISEMKSLHPDLVFIAEVYQKNLYGKYVREVGFDYLYDKSGMYDIIRSIVEKNVEDSGTPVDQWQSARMLTWNWQNLGDLQPYMLNFLENHDEQRFASDFFGRDASHSFAALYASLYLNTAPFMLYFGQEAGERGMDCEGLSATDGRTSIFDWWSPDAVRRLYLHIHGQDALSDGEKEILARYRQSLLKAREEKSLSDGITYDLCYCNYSSDGFSRDKHFAFLRDYADETFLVVCNFSSTKADMKISIPAHAFEWLELPETPELNRGTCIDAKVPPYDAIILKIS